MENDHPMPASVDFILNVVGPLILLFATIALIAREVRARRRAGPVRFRLGIASRAVWSQSLWVIVAFWIGWAVLMRLWGRDLASKLILIWVLWLSVWMISVNSTRRDVRYWLVLGSGLLSLVVGAAYLAIGLQALQARDLSARWLSGWFLVSSILCFVAGAAAVQEYLSGTRVRERGIEIFGTTQPWSRVVVKDWRPRASGFDLVLAIRRLQRYGIPVMPESELLVPVPASERSALEAFLAEHASTTG